MNKRDQFILMAKQGLSKPQGSDARMLYYYTSENSKGYDSRFINAIKELAPHWLQSKKQQETKKVKAKLLKLACQCKEKPKNKFIKDAIWRYTCPKSKTFDPRFVHELQLVAPNWLLMNSTNNKNSCEVKQELLNLAKINAPRPTKSKSKLGRWIWCLTSTKSKYYDQNFTQELKSLVPHWFVFPNLEDKIKDKNKKQQEILDLAKANQPKPKKGTRQERLLRSYCDPKSSSYDPHFLHNIKALKPHWLPKSFEQYRDETKKQLLDLAAANNKKPTYRESILGKKLSDFTSKYSRFYDSEFTQVIKAIRPEWFYCPIEQSKQLLLKMAQEGKPKPAFKEKNIGRKFSKWTKPKSPCFDPKLYKQLKELRPDWFMSSAALKKETLFKLAAQKLPKPKDRFRGYLYSYTQKNNKSYDPHFTKEIKLLAPHWFKNGIEKI